MSSDDEQSMCDEFYEWIQSSRWRQLLGRRSHEIARLLGPPSQVLTLVYRGCTWRRIVYFFNVTPLQATSAELASYRRGMHFAPTLLFRDDVCVPEAAFDKQLMRGRLTASIPENLRFREGGEFP